MTAQSEIAQTELERHLERCGFSPRRAGIGGAGEIRWSYYAHTSSATICAVARHRRTGALAAPVLVSAAASANFPQAAAVCRSEDEAATVAAGIASGQHLSTLMTAPEDEAHRAMALLKQLAVSITPPAHAKAQSWQPLTEDVVAWWTAEFELDEANDASTGK